MQMHEKAIFLNELANTYAINMRYTKAIEKYREALALYIHLAKKSPVKYALNIAHVFSNLSIIYLNLKKNKESEELHQNALKMHRALVKHNPNTYGIELARCLVDAVLYMNQHTFTLYEAEMVINRIEGQKGSQKLCEVIQKLHCNFKSY